jgi:hypothetical protein
VTVVTAPHLLFWQSCFKALLPEETPRRAQEPKMSTTWKAFALAVPLSMLMMFFAWRPLGVFFDPF